jgi:hypothetical protein
MADILPEKQNLQIEDLRTGAAASEATMQKVGGAVNFWNSYFEGTKQWNANGPYSITGVPDNGIDGVYPAWSDCEIYGVAFHNSEAGSSGDTEFDILRHPVGGGPAVSIFSTRPKIPFSAGNDARVIVQVLPTPTILFQSPGVTAPVMALTQLDAGDLLTMNIVAKQVDGKSASLSLAIRPR